MNDALSLWAALRTEHPERVARVADHIEPVHGTTQELVDRMLELRRSASTGDDRCGYVGNPYEQPAEDMSVLLSAAERISGLVAQSQRSRPNNSFKPNQLRGSA